MICFCAEILFIPKGGGGCRDNMYMHKNDLVPVLIRVKFVSAVLLT